MILLLNIYAPSSSDVRVVKYSIPIVSQVRGRVIEVPIEEGNRPVKKGDVLFRIDPTPYQLQVNTLTAQLASAVAQQRENAECEGNVGRHGDAPSRGAGAVAVDERI